MVPHESKRSGNTQFEKRIEAILGSFLNLDWKFGLFLIFPICIPRFALVLNANETGNYGFIGLIMLLSAVVPVVFLNKMAETRQEF